MQLRHDHIRVGLFDSETRHISATTRDDTLRETLFGIYSQSAVELTPWLRSAVGLRADHMRTRVDALSPAVNSGVARGTQVSPQLSLMAGPFEKTEVVVNASSGLHSNDAHGTTINTDPNTDCAVDKRVYFGDASAAEPSTAIPREGVEFNHRSSPLPWLRVDADLA